MGAGVTASLDPNREEAYALFRSGRSSPRNSALLLIGSLVLFGLAALPDRSVMDVVVVVAVLLFHELGHWAAMRVSGFRDTRIFFIPFFGAAASGRSADGSPLKEGVVLLAGPLPGLLLAIPILVAGTAQHDEALKRAGFTLLGINAFNLFPLVPLDGGRLFELLLFGRHPVLETGFRACGVAGLGALALWLHDWVLGVLAALVAVGGLLARRFLRVRESLRGTVSPDVPAAELPPEDMEALYGGAKEVLDVRRMEAQFGRQVKPAQLARMMVQLHDGLVMRHPGWRVSLMLLGGWLAGVVLVALGILAVIVTRRVAG
jgi:Zn-dependent protease